MKTVTRLSTLLGILFFIGILGGCVAGPAGPYYQVARDQPPAAAMEPFELGPNDITYILEVIDYTPFGLRRLPMTEEQLYNKGYDRVRRTREADFAIDIAFSASSRDNPDVRAGNMLGGAMLGAATGAIIGGATGDAGAGAAIGAASGGALGLVSPASTPMVRIDITITSFRDQYNAHRGVVVDLSSVPPMYVQRAIDNEVSRMLHSLPRR
ncbi:MAG: glycine zipper family protein [Syntrophobacteraceae bacterium]